jgi:regulator of sirC expression with transglutaminase-like and TPR domain
MGFLCRVLRKVWLVAEGEISARADLARWASTPDDKIDLALAALAIAGDEYPDLDVSESLAILDALADQARVQLERAPEAVDRVRALVTFLHEDVGFRGNLEAYDDPRNSFLNEVLVRGLGIPITLAIVYMEVSKRLGLTLSGVNFPGHFLVRYDSAPPLYIDPFAPSRLMCAGECEQLLAVMSEGQIGFKTSFLEPATPRQILVRLLRNLKLIYFRQGCLDKAVSAIDRILLLRPTEGVEYRDRGVAHLKLCEHRAALEDLTRYLELCHEAPDRSVVKTTIDYLRLRLAPLH